MQVKILLIMRNVKKLSSKANQPTKELQIFEPKEKPPQSGASMQLCYVRWRTCAL